MNFESDTIPAAEMERLAQAARDATTDAHNAMSQMGYILNDPRWADSESPDYIDRTISDVTAKLAAWRNADAASQYAYKLFDLTATARE